MKFPELCKEMAVVLTLSRLGAITWSLQAVVSDCHHDR